MRFEEIPDDYAEDTGLRELGNKVALAFVLFAAVLLAALLITAVACADESPRFSLELPEPVAAREAKPPEPPFAVTAKEFIDLKAQAKNQAEEIRQLRDDLSKCKADLNEAAQEAALKHATPAKVQMIEEPPEQKRQYVDPHPKQIVDTRPVLLAYSNEWQHPWDSRGCPPCQRLYNTSQLPGFPFHLDWRQPPPWVPGLPTLHWQTASGAWAQHNGWSEDTKREMDVLLAKYSQSNPAPAKASLAIPADALGKAQQFAGPNGTFSFAPDQPINATLDDGTRVSYSRLSGRYTFTTAGAQIILDQPLPKIDATKLFMHFGAMLQGVEYVQNPPGMTAVTNRGRYKIALEKSP